MRTCLFAFVAMLMISCNPAPDPVQRIDELFSSLYPDPAAPGTAVLLMQGDSILFEKCYARGVHPIGGTAVPPDWSLKRGIFKGEMNRNISPLNGALPLGLPTKPSEAGLLGKGGARERTQFSPPGGNGVERTLRRRVAVGKVGRRRGGETAPPPPQSRLTP